MTNPIQDRAQRCPACGDVMVFESKSEELEYKGRSTQIKTEAWWCRSCPEGILGAAALKVSERALLTLKAEVEGLLRPEEVSAIRERLRLSQRRAGQLLGGGPRAFQKYESGQVLLSAAMSNLLRLLDRDPSRVQELQDLKAG